MSTKRYAMLIDTTRCVGCQTCVVACKINYQVPGDASWCRVETIGSKEMYRPTGRFPRPVLAFRALLCNHCDEPPCVEKCPTGAMHTNENGIVSIYRDVCIGCGICKRSCPYDAPRLDEQAKKMGKCTFCMERIGSGEKPYCVEACPAEARLFGDISEPNSEISRRIAAKRAKPLMPQHGTKPSVYYV